ncbi:tRNA selenocysteine 1-associated protein 1 [Contarinia nasturtii]|uniref:tRNA selenocysteine 1-associated protein 1 n=1 Tax=Contarinia nasturtii TaxID=265458 RepID=UPI0012D4C28F|nr:tRNA selenocysteine 1-associated protein 1 [Contarinia nasturtii]
MSSLWMGNLECTYMTENFVISAFHKMGEQPQSVRLMRNKYTGEPAGYCFVNFISDEQAIDAMHKLNGKPIPGTNPVVRFRLNAASSNSNKLLANEREFSVWVGDLSPEVDDYNLYRVFSNKYSSIKTAKVILDSSGFSKGYGFVRFGIEEEQKSALYEMNGYIGLGSKPLKICNAVPKPKNTTNAVTNSTDSATISNLTATNSIADFSQYYDPTTYWQNNSLYGQQTSQWYDPSTAAAYYQQQAAAHIQQENATIQQQNDPNLMTQIYNQQNEDLTLIDHKIPIDIDQMNRESIERDRNFYDALESSKWMPIEQLELF